MNAIGKKPNEATSAVILAEEAEQGGGLADLQACEFYVKEDRIAFDDFKI